MSKRLKRNEFPTGKSQVAGQLWSPVYIIADLISCIDGNGYSNNVTKDEYIGEGDYIWIYQAVMYLREEYAKGAVMNAFAAQWCIPECSLYAEFNERWSKWGYPV